MAAFTPGAMGALRYVGDYHIRTAGAESNTAVGLAKLGIPVSWISRVGEDEFGHYICNQVRSEGVSCQYLKFDPYYRTGVMFKQTGHGETSVFYYRENSAASHMEPADLREEWFADAALLHISGITPVLSESCLATVIAAISLAQKYRVPISFDPNVRRKLWKSHDYSQLLSEIALQSSVVLLGVDEAALLFGTENPQEICRILLEAGKAEYIAIKNGSHGAWTADRTALYEIQPYPCHPIDPIGAGDGFNAGFLAGLLQGKTVAEAGRMGAICGALATEVPGDVEGYPDLRQMEQLLKREDIIFR